MNITADAIEADGKTGNAILKNYWLMVLLLTILILSQQVQGYLDREQNSVFVSSIVHSVEALVASTARSDKFYLDTEETQRQQAIILENVVMTQARATLAIEGQTRAVEQQTQAIDKLRMAVEALLKKNGISPEQSGDT